MPQSKHIIQKVFIEVKTNSSKKAFSLKDRLDVFMQHQVFPEMERYIDANRGKFSNDDIRLDKVELDICIPNIDDLNNLKKQMVSQFKIKMEEAHQKINRYSENNERIIQSHSKSNFDAFLYFIKTGLNPWWKPNVREILDVKTIREIISQKYFYEEFIKVLKDKNVRNRLVNQLDDALLSLLLTVPNSNTGREQRRALGILKNHVRLRDKFWMDVMDFHLSKDVIQFNTSLMDCAKMIIKESDYKTLETYASLLIGTSLKDVEVLTIQIPKEEQQESKTEESNTEESILNESEGVFINNAGLVLMHPFFKTFFINLKLANNEGQLIPSKIESAIHLLHYLATKKEQPFESELVLEKFLCGVPVGRTISRFVTLSDEQKRMAEEVLQAAISHWTALKNTSPDGLRTAFLQREGKLTNDNDTGRIVVERKTQDILLDKIPWNVHLIKLPWRKRILFVDW